MDCVENAPDVLARRSANAQPDLIRSSNQHIIAGDSGVQ